MVGVVVGTPAAVLLVLLHRSSGPGAGTESTEQILEREEISLWLESDKLSALPPGRKVQPGGKVRKETAEKGWKSGAKNLKGVYSH